MRTRVKFCGITRFEDAQLAVDYGADAIGMIFHAPSPRSIEPEIALEITAKLSPFINTVAVVVDQSQPFIDQLVAQTGVDTVQLHGNESAEFCQGVKTKHYKAIRVGEQTDIQRLADEYVSCRGFLLDTYVKGLPGGTGKTFDWAMIQGLNIDKPIILAGGLNPENVFAAVTTVRPYAVDLSSGVEIKPGIKDAGKLKETIIAVREADQQIAKNR